MVGKEVVRPLQKGIHKGGEIFRQERKEGKNDHRFFCLGGFLPEQHLPSVSGVCYTVGLSFFCLRERRNLHGKGCHRSAQSYITEIFFSIETDDGGPVGQSPEGSKACRYPAYAGIGIKTQAAQKQEEQAVQLKTKSAVSFFYDFPVQILRGEGDGTVENPGVDILKGHSALMGINQCVQSLRNKGLGIGKSNPFQILFCLFF